MDYEDCGVKAWLLVSVCKLRALQGYKNPLLKAQL